MNKATQSNFGRDRIEYFVKTLSDYRMLLIVPTVVCAMLALGYAVFKSNSWTVRQSLVIRDDLVGKSFKPGQSDSQDSLKSAQENILEIAREPQVIRNALKNLGHPPVTLTGQSSWPNEQVIEDVQLTISIGAPNGAEFGKTEVIVLSTKASSRERARKFIELLLTEIDQKLREVSSAKIRSMSEEFVQAVETARISFEQSADRLQEMDAKFGADLETLRSLNLPNSSDGSLQKTIVEIRSEQKRQATEVDLAKKQQEMLIKSYQDPAQYLVTSSDLLKMQPRLKQLLTGLSKSQLELAKVSGRYTEEQTEVENAKRAILDIKIQILKEIQTSIHALGANIEFGADRIQKLVDAENKLEEQLSELSSARVEYDKLEQEVTKKSEVLGQARQDLVQVQSVGQSTSDLLTRVGEPRVSANPDGPGKRTIVGAGILGGLLIGLGLIMFTAPPYEEDDQLETTSQSEQSQPPPPQSPAFDPTFQPPVAVDATAPEPQQPFFNPTADSGQPDPILPAFIQPPTIQSDAIQSEPAEFEAVRPEVVFQPRNVLEELNSHAQSALTTKKQSQPVEQDSDPDFEDRRVIPTRRKTVTTPAADSEFAAAISKVSADVERNAPDSKPKPRARVKSITEVFNPSIANKDRPGEPGSIIRPDIDPNSPNAEPTTAAQPMAEMEIVDDQSTFIKINSEPYQSTRVMPITAEPLDEHKLKHKSNVRPIDLTKVIQGLSLRKPDHAPAAEFATPDHDPETGHPQRVSESTIDLKDQVSFPAPADALENVAPQVESPENTSTFENTTELQSGPDEGQITQRRPGGVQRQSAVTEQLFVKQIYAPSDNPAPTPAQDESSPVTAEPHPWESGLPDADQPEAEPAAAEESGSAAGRDDVLKWGHEISDALSAAEIVQQLRVRQQQAAADDSTDAVKNVPQRPGNYDENAKTDQSDVVLRSSEQDDSAVLEIRRRSDSTDDDSQPITDASSINDRIKKLNDSIAEFCTPLKRKKDANEDDGG